MKRAQSGRRLRLLVLASLAILALLLPTVATAAPSGTPVEWGNSGGCNTVYVVHRGDTLTKISRWYGVSVRSMAAANNIYNPSRIYVGQRLCIPGDGYQTGGGYGNQGGGYGHQGGGYGHQENHGCSAWHTVQRGQTLSRISRYYGVSMSSMIQANNIYNPSRIYVGQSLCIPAGGGYPSQQPTYPSQQPMYPPPAPNPAPGGGSSQAAVTISNFAFGPQSLMVNAGATVTWTNRDGTFHTTTSDSGAWNSGQLGQGQSFSFTFNTPGTFSYHCAIHPTMTGTVVVSN